MALDLSKERYGSKAPSNGTYVSAKEILANVKPESVKKADTSLRKFKVDTDKFLTSVSRDFGYDTDDEEERKQKSFNAAEYFEERKRQADELKSRLGDATKNLEANAEYYTPEYYDSMMEYLSNFDTMVDDVLSNYKPSLDSREGMRAYEDEMIAAMERNSRYVDERKPHNGTLLSYNEDTEDFIPDYSYRSVNSNWTPEQRYTLGQLQNPEEAQKYATEVNKYLSNMGMYAEQERQRQEMAALDLDAAKREIDQLQAELDNFYATHDYTADAEYRQKQKELTQKTTLYNQAKRQHEAEAFRSVTGNDDFAAKSGYVSTEAQNFRDRMFSEYGMGYNDLTYEYINDPERVQAYNDEFTRRMLESNYELMQNDEIAIYNYLYATEGKKTAQAYLDDIADTLSKRRSDQTFSTIKGNTAKELLFGINAGVNQFLSNTKSLFSDDDYIPTTATQMTSQRVREDLQDRAAIKKAETGRDSIAPLLYDVTTTTFNMIPSMAAGALANAVLPGSGAYVGSALMGASAAGGAYQEAINSGYSKEQARTYSTMVGIVETGMESMLGLVGGGMPDAIKKKAIDAVDGAIAKFAIEQGANMISEGFEEGLQEVISPWIENVFLMAEKENADIKDVAYASLLGALSTLPFAAVEGGKTAVTSWESRRAAPATAAAPTAEVKTFQIPVETPKVSTEGKAMKISSEEALDVKDFASMSDNGATIMTNDGDVVDYDDVSWADQKQANQFYAVRSLPGLDTEAANDLLTAIQNADAGQDTDSVIGIRDAYRIGYFNQDVKGLKTGDASVLSPELRQAVYDIGVRQNQAEAAVKAAATPVTTKPSKGYQRVTLEGNIKLNSNQKAQVDFIDKFSDKVSKTSVHVFESYVKNGKRYYKDSRGKEVLAPNGKYVNGEIWVDLKAGDKGEGLILNTFAHEMYHHIESQNKAGANKLASWVSKNMGIKNVDAAVEAQIRKARAAGYGEKYFRDKGMSAEQARNEVYTRAMSDFVADSLETMFTRGDPADAIAQLYKEDRTLFDQIKEFIDKFISQVKQFYSDKTISAEGAAVAQLENFQELQRMFMEAAKGAGENYQAAGLGKKQDSTEKFSYGGRFSATADMSAFEQAEKMEENGLDNESIRQQTGWFKGMDGKWRYEIDDSQMTVSDNISNYMRLGDLIQHEKLFSSYPDLANIDVVFQSLDAGTNGSYNHQFDSINLNYKLKNDPFGLKDSLVHEIQHAIQQREGFTRGATSQSWDRKIKAGFDSRRKADIQAARETEIELRRIQDEEPEFYRDMLELDAMTPDIPRGEVDWETLEKISDDPIEWQRYDARREELEDKYGDTKVWDMNDLLYQRKKAAKNMGRSGVELYFDTAGEIEARDVANRRSKSEEQRKSTPPRLGNEDTVFAEGNHNSEDYIPGDVSESELSTGINEVAKMTPVSSINGSEFTTEGRTLLDDVDRFFKIIGGQVYNSRLGHINLTRRGVKDSLAHGMTPEKASAFAAIPDVLRDGKVVGFEKNWKNRGYDSATVVAPITIAKEEYLMAVIVHRSNSANRFYVHDAFTIKKEATPFMTGTQNMGEPGGVTSTVSIIRKILGVKTNENQATEKFSLRNEKPLTNREILEQLDIEKRRPQEKGHLNTYRERLAELREKKPKLAEVNARIQELSADPVKNKAEINKLKAEARGLKRDVDSLNRKIREQEQGSMFVKIVGEERLKAQKQQARNSLKFYKDEQRKMVEEMQLEQRVIREELTGKKSDITIMEREFVRIAKQYEKLDERTGKKSAKDAKVIAELKAALKEEAKSHSEDSKIWEREFNRLLKDYETSGRQIEQMEATIARNKERVQSRIRTQIKHNIEKKVNDLNKMLLHGTKHRNVPEVMQPALATLLDSINMRNSTHYMDTLMRYDRRIATEPDPEIRKNLIDEREAFEQKGDPFLQKMLSLKEAYKQIQKENNALLDEDLILFTDALFETVGNTPLRSMNREQLEAVSDILDATMATIRNANQLLAEERSAGVLENSKNAVREIKSAGETKKTKTRLRKQLEQFGWNNLKPTYVFDVIGSKTLTNLYESLRNGEDTLAVDLDQAKTFFRDQWKKNGGKEWDMEKKWKFESTSGKSFELDLNQIMSLYAMSKDKDARSHLRVGGFAFDSDYQTQKKVGPIKIKVESTDASAYNLSDEILGEIISTLTPKQRAFADAMQAYLSDTMAAKGNEVSLKKYGIRLFKKKDYFPIRVADQFMAKAREQQAGNRKLKDSGFTKERKPEAKNPVVLSAFTEIWAEHVDEMSLYHSFVLPLDDFNRVLNYHDAFVEGQEAVSVVEAITNAFGNGATNYIDQLIKDVNGGARNNSTVSFANQLVSKAKKAQTMASLSVAIQQPSSIIRAMSTVDAKYFIGPKVTEKTTERTWEEIKRYAPIAIIKEMVGYDTNVGKSTVDYLTDTSDYETFGEKFKALFTDSNYRDEQLGRLPAWMDETSWSVIWNAVKREQRDLHPNMDVNSRAFMNSVADRFTEVITRTQVYDSVFSRSGMMRDKKSDLAKMITSFMAEPTTASNMTAVSLFLAKRGDIKGKQAVRTIGANVASLALNAALVSIIYAMRDDDEDKRYDEKYLENFRNNFFESLNPATYIPYVRDVYNLFAKGYDVERADMELFGDLQNAIEGLGNEDITAWEKTENVIGAIGNLLGVPVKNILRDVKGIVQTMGFAFDDRKNPRTKTGTYMARRGMDLNDKEQMILAVRRGDEEHLQRVFGRYETQEDAERALQGAIREKYVAGEMDAQEAQELLDTYFDRDDEHDIYWILDEWDYAKEHGNTDGYTKMGALLDAVDSGDYEAEIQRYLDHGSEMSEIQDAITKKYKKQYLAADEAGRESIRDKMMQVYQDTGMYESDILKRFNDWDFESEYGMTYSDMKAEYREGNVTESDLRNAMTFYGRKKFEIDQDIRDLNEDIKFREKFDMSLSQMKDAYDNGDVTKRTLENALIYSGMTKKEAQQWITQRDISNQYGIDYMYLDDAYKAGDISRADLYNSMIKNGATKQEADDAILAYDWLKKNYKKYPDLAVGDAKKFAVRLSSDQPDYTLTDFGVKIDDYIEYSKLRPDCKGIDANGDGKADDGTKRDAIFRMIDSLPISNEAKDGLALLDYGFKSIKKNAPWH